MLTLHCQSDFASIGDKLEVETCTEASSKLCFVAYEKEPDAKGEAAVTLDIDQVKELVRQLNTWVAFREAHYRPRVKMVGSIQ